MTRIPQPACHAIALLLLLTLLLLPAAQAREMVSVDRAEINMRAGAGTDQQALWRLDRGYPLMVTAKKGKWLKVRDFENDEGWVYGPLTSGKPHFVVNSPIANIRSGPGMRYRVVGKAEYGAVLRRLEIRAKWAKVKSGAGLTGWVSRNLLWGW